MAPIATVSTASSSSSISSMSCHERKVTFAASKVINEENNVISQEELHARWLTQEDLDEIKKSAGEISLRLRKLAKQRSCHVETAHKKTSLVVAGNFSELVKMSASSPDQDLLHWCARSDGRRGLERYASRKYGCMRKEDVLRTRMAVFQEQEIQRKLQMFEPEELGKVSKAKSRRARTFSLFMGEADAQAAIKEVPPESSKQVQVSKRQRLHCTNTAPSSFPSNRFHCVN